MQCTCKFLTQLLTIKIEATKVQGQADDYYLQIYSYYRLTFCSLKHSLHLDVI